MKYDYCSWLIGREKESIKEIINCSITNVRERQKWMQRKLAPLLWKNGELIWNNLVRLSVLAHDDKIREKKCVEDIKSIYREKIISNSLDFSKEFDLLKAIFSYPPDLDIKRLPENSWFIQFAFRLAKPYISRDDTSLYIIDNPVRKEWISKVPFVSASQWKGALRTVMIQEMASDFRNQDKFIEARLRLYRLFGNEKDGTAKFLSELLAKHLVGQEHGEKQDLKELEEKIKVKSEKIGQEFEEILVSTGLRKDNSEGFRGSLYFFPTYFNAIDLEVINPHSRKSGSGTKPIYIECVPEGKDGIFTILYVPFDEAGQEQAVRDAEITAKGISAMMTKYGFGAKTSSGFGTAEENLLKEGRFVINTDKKESHCCFKSLPDLADNIKNLLGMGHGK